MNITYYSHPQVQRKSTLFFARRTINSVTICRHAGWQEQHTILCCEKKYRYIQWTTLPLLQIGRAVLLTCRVHPTPTLSGLQPSIAVYNITFLLPSEWHQTEQNCYVNEGGRSIVNLTVFVKFFGRGPYYVTFYEYFINHGLQNC